jgi:hypothetical protein
MRRRISNFRGKQSNNVLRLANAIRRVVVSTIAGGQSNLEGYDFGNGTVEGQDDPPVDVFGGMYVYAKPAAADNAEALLLHVGAEAEHPTVAATRNEDARKRFVEEHGDIDPGEVAIFNSTGKAHFVITAGGDIIAEVPGGSSFFVREKGGAPQAVALADHKHELPLLVEGTPNTYHATTGSGNNTKASDSNSTSLKAN